jgi:hypothetical protein
MSVKRAPSIGELVHVGWIDSASYSHWTGRETLQISNPITIESAGWLLRSDSTAVVLAAHKSDQDNYTGDMCIPRSQVKTIRRLK